MSATQQLSVAPVPASIDNPSEWQVLVDQITLGTAISPAVTPEIITGMVGSAVPLLFAADGANDTNLLRGTFSDAVVAQCMRNAGVLARARPVEVVVHLVGARVVDGQPRIRTHLTIQARDADDRPSTVHQFWDLQCGGEVTVSQSICPNCGAPVGTGELVCSHCHADVRNVVVAPLVVSRLELY